MGVTELAWAAGFFDSSGTICFPLSRHRGDRTRQLYLYVKMPAKDEECAREFIRMFGGHVYRQGPPHRKWMLDWRASCEVAERFLRRVKPYLRRKSDAARVALLMRETRVPAGARFLTASTKERRQALEVAIRVFNHSGSSRSKGKPVTRREFETALPAIERWAEAEQERGRGEVGRELRRVHERLVARRTRGIRQR